MIPVVLRAIFQWEPIYQIEHTIRADAELPRDTTLREADVFRQTDLQSAVLADQPHQLDRVI